MLSSLFQHKNQNTNTLVQTVSGSANRNDLSPKGSIFKSGYNRKTRSQANDFITKKSNLCTNVTLNALVRIYAKIKYYQ